jgi:hypothetical protein
MPVWFVASEDGYGSSDAEREGFIRSRHQRYRKLRNLTVTTASTGVAILHDQFLR